jgi:hypothetical protein
LLDRVLEGDEVTVSAFVSADELSGATFSLLTASSGGRYIQMAKEGAARSTFRRWLARNPERIPDVLAHARTLWRAVLETSERDVPEWELAIVLPILAQTAGHETDLLLRAVALSERRNAAWLAALARRLLHERAENQSGPGPWRARLAPGPMKAENRAESRLERLLTTDGVGARSTEEHASQRILLVT